MLIWKHPNCYRNQTGRSPIILRCALPDLHSYQIVGLIPASDGDVRLKWFSLTIEQQEEVVRMGLSWDEVKELLISIVRLAGYEVLP